MKEQGHPLGRTEHGRGWRMEEIEGVFHQGIEIDEEGKANGGGGEGGGDGIGAEVLREEGPGSLGKEVLGADFFLLTISHCCL